MRTILVIALLSAAGRLTEAQTADKPLHAVSDPGVVTTRQAITPAGVPTVFDGRVYGVTYGKTPSDLWVANASRLYRLDVKGNRIAEMIPTEGQPGMQGIRFDATAARPLAVILHRKQGSRAQVGLFTPQSSKLTAIAEGLAENVGGSVAVAEKPDSSGRRIAVVALTPKNQIAVIDVDHSKLIGYAPSGIAPFATAISKSGEVALVSNWGGRIPNSSDKTARAGRAENADPVVIDDRGIASTGTISRIDLKTLSITHTIAVGLHPTGLIWDETSNRLYVANGNSDSVSVIDTAKNTLLQTFPINPFAPRAPKSVAGIAPTALALSFDRKKLYVACGGINAIAVLDAQTGAMRGSIPTAWYPNALSVAPDGKSLAVSTLLGAGPGWRDAPNKKYVHADRGSVAIIPMPDDAQLASYTAAVLLNNRMKPADSAQHDASRLIAPTPIPARSESSAFPGFY